MPHFGIRTERYKLIRFYGDGNFWELYDLKKDPTEMNNLYGRPKYHKLTQSLKERLEGLITQFDDQEALSILND
jgi:arylsulfatase A-like enzyme